MFKAGHGEVRITYGADLAVAVSGGGAAVNPGDPVSSAVAATNHGPADIPAASVKDVFPASLEDVSWSCAGTGGATCTAFGAGDIDDTVDLPVGASVTYTVTATVAPSASGTLTHTATVSDPGDLDPDPANNAATVTLDVKPAPAPAAPTALPAPADTSPGVSSSGVDTTGGGAVAVCTRRRLFPLRLSAIYRAGRARVLSATLTRTNGRRVRHLKTSRTRVTVDLRGTPKSTYLVRVRVRLASGATRTIVRRHRTCEKRI